MDANNHLNFSIQLTLKWCETVSWNFEWYQLFILVGSGGNRCIKISFWRLVRELAFVSHRARERVKATTGSLSWKNIKVFWQESQFSFILFMYPLLAASTEFTNTLNSRRLIINVIGKYEYNSFQFLLLFSTANGSGSDQLWISFRSTG